MMANQIDDKPSLPSYLVRCEYLESTGTQYIDLGYPLGYNNKVMMDIWANTASHSNGIFGNSVNSTRRFSANTGTSSSYCTFGSAIQNTPKHQDKRQLWIIDKSGIVVDDNNYNWNTIPTDFTTDGNVTVFAIRTSATAVANHFKGKIYSCQIYENDILIHDYIPTLNINLSRAGMYDLVTGIFLTNNGTGEFVFEIPYIPDTQKPYLCFEAVEDDFQAKFTGTGLHYSFDKKDWIEIPPNQPTPSIKAGIKIWFKGQCPKSSTHPYSRGNFSTTKLFNISGKMTSLEYGDDFIGKTPVSYSFASMFSSNKNVVRVSDDFFDYGSVSTRTFLYTFQGSSIKSAKLNAAGSGAFQQCFLYSALESVEIINSKLEAEMYTAAFQNSKLKMLYLPSKSYANSAYNGVARGCSRLESVRIDSIRLNSAMLTNAFNGCTMLSKVTLLAVTELSKSVSNNWLTGVAEEGTIILNKNITWNPEDYKNGNIDNVEGSATLGDTITWGIPAGWEVKYCDPDNIDDVRDYREIDKAWD
jgi:hypothetical protein